MNGLTVEKIIQVLQNIQNIQNQSSQSPDIHVMCGLHKIDSFYLLNVPMNEVKVDKEGKKYMGYAGAVSTQSTDEDNDFNVILLTTDVYINQSTQYTICELLSDLEPLAKKNPNAIVSTQDFVLNAEFYEIKTNHKPSEPMEQILTYCYT